MFPQAVIHRKIRYKRRGAVVTFLQRAIDDMFTACQNGAGLGELFGEIAKLLISVLIDHRTNEHCSLGRVPDNQLLGT